LITLTSLAIHRKNKIRASFKSPRVTVNDGEPGADPLATLYADEQVFGHQFDNPLRKAEWWGNAEPFVQERELSRGGFLATAALGMGMNLAAPTSRESNKIDNYDSSATDPATGRTFYYSSRSGARVWEK